jgi:maleylacetate reductase
MNFDHSTLGQRIRFDSHQAAQNLAQEVSERGAQRVMLIAGEFELEMAREVSLQVDVALEHSDVVMHVPIETAEKARAAASAQDIDLIVCVGGGSTTGLAKAVALTTGIPIVAVPTTYAGSEATNVWGLTENERKTTGVDNKVLPETIIYDAALTLSLPVDMSVASALNGMAHCIDSMWGPRADPINAAMASEGIRALNIGIQQVVKDPQGLPGRERALYGAYLSAVSFASAGSGLHHKICHVLGGTFDLPHAQTHATVLPYVLAFNQEHAPEAAERIAAAFRADEALSGLQQLRTAVSAPTSLADYGFTEAGIATAVEIILGNVPANNPRDVTEENLTELLTAALHGHDPATLLTEPAAAKN